jgi:aminopeptidase N
LRDQGAVAASVRSALLNVVATNATIADWEQIHALASASRNPAEQREYYTLLGAATDPELAQRALELALGDAVPVTVRPQIIAAVARHAGNGLAGPRGADVATQFAIAHWPAIEPLLDARAVPRFVPDLANDSFAPDTIDALNAFAAAHFAASGRSSLVKAVAQIRINGTVRARLGEIDSWIAARALDHHGD